MSQATPAKSGFVCLTSFVLGALALLAAAGASPVLATDLIIQREVPVHNVLEQPLPPNTGNTVAVPVEQKGLILSLVPNSKMLNDGDFGGVLASPPPNGVGAPGAQNDLLGPSIDGSRGEPLSNLPGSGMGSFSSLGGLGGQISGQVGGSIGGAMQGLTGALGTMNPSSAGAQ